jgi:hypothetical protein
MAAYYKVDVVLNSQAVQVGLPSPQSVSVTLPLVGPAGPVGPKGDKGDPGEVSGSIAWDNVTEKPTTFPPSTHTHAAADITDFTTAVEAVSPPADWNTLANKPSTFPPSTHTHVASDVTDFSTAAAAAAPVQSVAGKTGTVTLAKADVGLSNVDNTSDTNKPISSATQSALDGKAATSHTHTASQVTDFNTAAAAAAPVQSVNGSTGTVTVAVPSASSATPQALGVAAAGTSNDFSRADHVHAMPSASDVGAAAATHASTHFSAGADPLAPSDIGAQSNFITSTVDLSSGNVTLTAGRARIIFWINFSGGVRDLTLPSTGNLIGDTFVIRRGSGNQGVDIYGVVGNILGKLDSATTDENNQNVYIWAGNDTWVRDRVIVHTHAASAITSGTLDVARLPVGTGSTQVAAGNHTHVVADVTGAAASGSITTSGLTQATARILGRTTASTGSIEEIQIGSGLSLSAGELSATGGGGEVRSDFVSPYTYTGLAAAGTSESTASWTIRRSEFDAGGSFVATLTASAVKWDDRLTASYV